MFLTRRRVLLAVAAVAAAGVAAVVLWSNAPSDSPAILAERAVRSALHDQGLVIATGDTYASVPIACDPLGDGATSFKAEKGFSADSYRCIVGSEREPLFSGGKLKTGETPVAVAAVDLAGPGQVVWVFGVATAKDAATAFMEKAAAAKQASNTKVGACSREDQPFDTGVLLGENRSTLFSCSVSVGTETGAFAVVAYPYVSLEGWDILTVDAAALVQETVEAEKRLAEGVSAEEPPETAADLLDKIKTLAATWMNPAIDDFGLLKAIDEQYPGIRTGGQRPATGPAVSITYVGASSVGQPNRFVVLARGKDDSCAASLYEGDPVPEFRATVSLEDCSMTAAAAALSVDLPGQR